MDEPSIKGEIRIWVESDREIRLDIDWMPFAAFNLLVENAQKAILETHRLKELKRGRTSLYNVNSKEKFHDVQTSPVVRATKVKVRKISDKQGDM